MAHNGTKDRQAQWRPSKEEQLAAAGRSVPDIIGPNLRIVFCGINPSLYSAATGHHFARPGNRFWKALHGSGITETLLSPFDDRRLLQESVGITNLVQRATVAASDLSTVEIKEGARRLEVKVRRCKPRVLAVLGLQAFSTGFAKRAVIGRQEEMIAGVPVFVLANPSGLQARYQLPDLIEMFAEVHAFSLQ